MQQFVAAGAALLCTEPGVNYDGVAGLGGDLDGARLMAGAPNEAARSGEWRSSALVLEWACGLRACKLRVPMCVEWPAADACLPLPLVAATHSLLPFACSCFSAPAAASTKRRRPGQRPPTPTPTPVPAATVIPLSPLSYLYSPLPRPLPSSPHPSLFLLPPVPVSGSRCSRNVVVRGC